MSETFTHDFEDALRAIGLPRLRLDQVVTAYHKAFPANAMRPDMRERLHDALLHLVQEGVITVSVDEDGGPDGLGSDPNGLPRTIVLSDLPA